jgi:hypothetical protein
VLGNEGMRCTRIKQYSSRDGVNKECTKHDIRCFFGFSCVDMIQTASCSICLSLLVPPRGSTALTLIGSRRAKARRSRLLQGTLLREMSWLATSVAAASLAVVGGIEDVAVAFRGVPACRAVILILAVGVVGPGSLRGEPLRGWRTPRWGHTAGPLTAWSTLTHHPSLPTFAGSFVLVFHHDGSIHHGFQIIVRHGYQIGL